MIAIRTGMTVMPECCSDCRYKYRNEDEVYCNVTHFVQRIDNPDDGRASFCPLVEVEDEPK